MSEFSGNACQIFSYDAADTGGTNEYGIGLVTSTRFSHNVAQVVGGAKYRIRFVHIGADIAGLGIVQLYCGSQLILGVGHLHRRHCATSGCMVHYGGISNEAEHAECTGSIAQACLTKAAFFAR